MGTSAKTNRVSQLAADQNLADGTKQFLSQVPSIPVGGQDYTPAQIEQVFLDRIATGKAAVAAEDARKAAVKADRDERKKTAPFVNAFRRIVIGMFLQTPDKLGVFGLQAPRVGKKTAASKAAAVQKTTATKKARGPIGRKQRAKVKAPAATATGTEPAPVAPTPVAPAATPGSATASPAAAPAAGAAGAAPKAGS
jgi:hypothetical protein